MLRGANVNAMKHKYLSGSDCSRRGFTLTEIIVVTAIVSILTALLIPAFSSVREGMRTTSCASNLKQIGLAISQYVSDNNGRYPLIAQAPNCSWVDTVFPYAKSVAVFQCPSADHGEYVPGCGPGGAIGNDISQQEGFNGSYDMVTPFVSVESVTTTNSGSTTTTTYKIDPKSLSSLRYRAPSSTILVLDGNDHTYFFHSSYAAVNPGVDPIHNVNDLKDGGVVAVHRDGVNLLYVDGHVKWQNLQSLTSTPMWRYDNREPAPPK